MKPKIKKNLYWLIGLLIVVAFAVVMAYQVRSDFGKVEVSYVKISTKEGKYVTALLYKPVDASTENKLPGIFIMHGWNNDKDTAAPSAIELSRRGFVTLSLDAAGHGDSTAEMNLADVNKGDLLGADYAYDYLASLPYVDATRMGMTGHSMGASTSAGLALQRPDNKAIVLQALCPPNGLPYRSFRNFLCIYGMWEEMDASFGSGRGDEMYKNKTFYEGLGYTEPIVWNTLSGNFEDGTAFQVNLNRSGHPGTPPSHQMITSLVDWMRRALKDGKFDKYWIPEGQHIYTFYDVFMGLAFLAAIASVIPLANILLTLKFFAPVVTGLPKGKVAKPKDWWRMALINALIAMVTYPIFASLGGIILGPGLKQNIMNMLPFMKEPVPNGLVFWMIANAIIFVILFAIWYKKNKVSMYDMGVSFHEKNTKLDWGVIGKTALLAILLAAWLYLLVGISQAIFHIEFRAEVATLKTIPTIQRFGQFLVWMIPVLIFMFLNNGIFLFGQARQPEYENEGKTTVIWWLKNCFAAVSMLALYLGFQYIPAMVFNQQSGLYMSGLAPALDSVGLTYSSMYALVLFHLIPFFAVLLFIVTWSFRKTGKVYLGTFISALVISWAFAVGHQISP